MLGDPRTGGFLELSHFNEAGCGDQSSWLSSLHLPCGRSPCFSSSETLRQLSGVQASVSQVCTLRCRQEDQTRFAFFCRPHHSRVKCTDPSAKKCLVMDADDEAVLNLIAECEWDLSNPPGSMSSSQKESEASLQSSQGRLLLAKRVGTQPGWEADCCLRIHAVFLRELTFKCRIFRKSCAPVNISNLIMELQAEKSVYLGGCSHIASLLLQVPLGSVVGVANM